MKEPKRCLLKVENDGGNIQLLADIVTITEHNEIIARDLCQDEDIHIYIKSFVSMKAKIMRDDEYVSITIRVSGDQLPEMEHEIL